MVAIFIGRCWNIGFDVSDLQATSSSACRVNLPISARVPILHVPAVPDNRERGQYRTSGAMQALLDLARVGFIWHALSCSAGGPSPNLLSAKTPVISVFVIFTGMFIEEFKLLSF